MLVLTRRVGERILVGDKIVITCVRIGPNAVRIGITAPPNINIVREELVDPENKDCGMAALRAGGGTFDGLMFDSPVDGVTVPGGSGHAIQVSEDDLAGIGRRPRSEFLKADEVADAFVENEMIDHG